MERHWFLRKLSLVLVHNVSVVVGVRYQLGGGGGVSRTLVLSRGKTLVLAGAVLGKSK